MIHKALNPEGWKRPKGYSNGVVAQGKMIFTGGVTGWNKDEVFESSDFNDQLRQTLQNIVDILAVEGAGPEHVTRLTWYITDKQEYLADLAGLGAAYRDTFGRNFPAMAVVQVVALIEDEAKIEIEATAVIPND